MKNYFKFSLVVITTFSFLSSCNKDDDDVMTTETVSNEPNTITYNNQNIEITGGLLKELEQNDSQESYDFDLTVYDESISFDNSSNLLKGTGNLVYLDLNSSSNDGITSGTYTLNDGSNTANTIAAANIGINYNALEYEGSYISIVSGSADVTRNDDSYEIIFNGTTSDNKTVHFNYSGTPNKSSDQ